MKHFLKFLSLFALLLLSSAVVHAQILTSPNGLPINGGTLLGPVNFQGTGTAGYDATIGVTGGGSSVDRGIGYLQAGKWVFETYDGTIQFGTDSVPGATEYYLASAGVAGSNPTLTCINVSATGNVSCSIVGQGAGGVLFGDSEGSLFNVTPASAAAVTDYPEITAPTTAGGAVTVTTANGTYFNYSTSITVGTPTGGNECANGCVNAAHVYKNGAEILPSLPTSSFASLPTAATGNTGSQYLVTDWNSVFVSTGTKWVPADGRVTVYKKTGSEATPLATLTGTTAAQFSITGGFPTIPTNLLTTNSRVIVTALTRKVGTGGTYTLSVRMGNTGTTSDPALWAFGSLANTNNADVWLNADATVSSSTNYTTTNYAVANSTSVSGAAADRNFNFNTGGPNTISLDIGSANAADTFNLIRLTVEVWP